MNPIIFMSFFAQQYLQTKLTEITHPLVTSILEDKLPAYARVQRLDRP